MMTSMMAWQPHLTIAGCVLALDMTRSETYTVTAGSPDTVTSITNQVSGTAWSTSVTAFPKYEAAGVNGLPCMLGESVALGGGTNRGISSTEAAVVNAFSGEDKVFTVIAVNAPVDVTTGNKAIFAAANSGSSVEYILFRAVLSTTQRWNFQRSDGAATVNVTTSASPAVAAVPQVVTWVSAGTTGSIYLNLAAANPSAAASDIGDCGPNRAAIMCLPDLTPDSFFDGRMVALYAYTSALTDADRIRLVSREMARAGIW